MKSLRSTFAMIFVWSFENTYISTNDFIQDVDAWSIYYLAIDIDTDSNRRSQAVHRSQGLRMNLHAWIRDILSDHSLLEFNTGTATLQVQAYQ